MPQLEVVEPIKVYFTLEEIQQMIIPALHVCRAIQLDLQSHACLYHTAAIKGSNGLIKMFYLAQERSVK